MTHFALYRDGQFVEERVATSGMYVQEDGIAIAWDVIRTDPDLAVELGLYLIVTDLPAFDRLTHEVGEPTRSIDGHTCRKTYVPTGRALTVAVKTEAKAEIRTWRDRIEFSPFVHADLWFSGDDKAMRRLTGAATVALAAKAAGQPYQNEWSTFDGAEFLIADADSMIALGTAKALAFQAAFRAAKAAIAAVDAAQSAEACRAAVIAYKTSFPATVLILDAEEWQRHQAAVAAPGYAADPFTTFVNLSGA